MTGFSELLPDVMAAIPLDRREISQEKLDIVKKHRSNLFPWNGQFSPQLIEVILKTYANKNSKVFDPFLGSGTILAEAANQNLSAAGTEINPAAYQFSLIYCLCNETLQTRNQIITSIESELEGCLGHKFTFLSSGHRRDVRPFSVDRFVEIFNSLRDPSVRSVFKTLLILLDFKAKKVDTSRLSIVWNRLKEVILTLPYTEKRISALNRDARKTLLKPEMFDLIVTSPPYINVFNYHQNYRSTAETFGHNLLEVARSEIGSNRKHRRNRFLTVIQYIMDMKDVFDEIKRVSVEDARIIFVVGRESNVRKTRFLNGEIITNIAYRCCGLKPILRQERVFTNKFGQKIFEDLVHFKLLKGAASANVSPRVVAVETLNSARTYVSCESLQDLESAITEINSVAPSPIFSNKNSEAT